MGSDRLYILHSTVGWRSWDYLREEQWETCRGGQTTQKANIYFGDFGTSQPEQVLTFSLVKYHWEVSSEAQISLRRFRYSSPHLAPRTASRQPYQERFWPDWSMSLSLSLSIYIYIYTYIYTYIWQIPHTSVNYKCKSGQLLCANWTTNTLSIEKS